MPQIPTYNDNILPQGSIGTRASAADFGGQIGAGLERLGSGMSSLGEGIAQYNETQDVTNVHVNMAKARAEWTQTLQERERTATPGDDAFAPTLMKDMEGFFQKGAASATTKKGQQLWATLSATMTSEFGQRAVGVQAELSAKDAVNKYDTLLKSSGSAVYNNPGQVDATLAQAKAAIDDPNGIFAKVPATARDKFKHQIEHDINFAASRGFVRSHPEELLNSVAPDMLAQFKPFESLIKSGAAPGGKVSVSASAMKLAPEVAAAAASKGLNANILIAQLDAESGGRTDVVSPKGAAGVAQFMPETAKQYGVDVKDAKSSIKGQAAYMSDLLNQFGGDYAKALAAYNWGPGNLTKALQRWGAGWQNHLPEETANYIQKIMTRSGVMSGPVDADAKPELAPAEANAGDTQVAPQKPVASTLPFFSGLTWEQQDSVVKEAIQLQHLRMSMGSRLREEQKFQLDKERDKITGSFINQIIDPAKYGKFSEAEVLANPTLTWQEKQHVVDYQLTRKRELQAMAENRSNPGEVRRLELAIHAADDDPTKTYNMDPIMESYRLNRISTTEMRMLRGEVEQLRSGDGNNFQKEVQRARQVAETALVRSLVGQMQPEVAAEAAYRFNRDLDAKIAEYRKDNKDPRVLLDPMSREYMLKPERIQGFMPGASAAMAGQAGKEKKALPTYKDYEKLKNGDSYTDPSGNVRVKGARS